VGRPAPDEQSHSEVSPRLLAEEFIRSPGGELRPLREVRCKWAFGLGSHLGEWLPVKIDPV